jgi:hypothetical protein
VTPATTEGGHARRGRGAVNVPQACTACSALRPRRPSDQRWAYGPSSLILQPHLASSSVMARRARAWWRRPATLPRRSHER